MISSVLFFFTTLANDNLNYICHESRACHFTQMKCQAFLQENIRLEADVAEWLKALTQKLLILHHCGFRFCSGPLARV